jgi:hypothetical protein
MPMQNQRACQESLCPFMAEPGGWKCTKHIAETRQRDSERGKKQRGMYGTTWDKFKLMLRGHGNTICAKLTDGVQCTHPVEIFHHLISPQQRPDLMLVPANVIPLCRIHHPKDEGTPGWKAGVDYVPTVYKVPTFG